MNKSVIYITNDNPYYMVMTANSINMLRRYNKTLPVKVFFLENYNGNETRYMQKSEFLANCDYLDAEIIRTESVVSEEKDFFCINKVLLKNCKEDQIFYMDADTFIFGDIEPLFETYKDYDVVACENAWVSAKKGWVPELISHNLKPMNGGVMLWKRNWLVKACEYLPEGCKQLREGNSPLAQWLQKHNQLWSREEFTFTDFAAANRLKCGYFARSEAYNIRNEYDIEHCRESIIFHSYGLQWKSVFRYLRC